MKAEIKEFKLMPCAPDVCQECAVKHEPSQPHNAQSLYYHFKFHSEHKRSPTWKDAISHCDTELQKRWEVALKERNAWTEPLLTPVR